MPLDALFDQEFLDLLGGTMIEEMNVTVVGSIAGEVPEDFNIIYANCNTSVKLDSWSGIKLTPDILIAALARFINCFHRVRPGHSLAYRQGLKTINIHCITPVLLLDCQYVQILFEAFYKSSFYDITQHFDVMDSCKIHRTSSASHIQLPGYSGNTVLFTLNYGYLGINQQPKFFYLREGLVLQQNVDKNKAQVCTKNRQLYTYSQVDNN